MFRIKTKSNILLVFILLVALVVIASSFVFLVIGKMKSVGPKDDYSKALDLAEAGLSKAIWYIFTPVPDGGKGPEWRGTTTEAFGTGTYTITVAAGTGDIILLTSKGSIHGVERTVQESIDAIAGITSIVEHYGVFNYGNFDLGGSSHIYGDMFANGNITIGSAAGVTSGEVYHTTGTTVSGGGAFTDGGDPGLNLAMPTLNTTSYDSQISTAQTMPAGGLSKTSSFSLGGGTLYVNGSVSISGTTTISGPGTIVATGPISFTGSISGNGTQMTFISQDSISLSGSAALTDATFYARNSLSTIGSGDFTLGSFITPGDVSMSGNSTFKGIAFALGTVDLGGSAELWGSVVAGQVTGLTGHAQLYHSTADLPPDIQTSIIVGGGGYKMVAGSWKEL